MNIRQKMLLIVISGTLFSAILGTMLIYEFVQRNILINETANLQKITTRFTSVATQRFSESEPKLKAFASLLESELKKPIKTDEIKTFRQLFDLNSDGVWRNRKSNFNGQLQAGMFLPTQPKENDLQKIQHLRIKKMMDIFGLPASKRLENVWYLSPERSEIIFDKTYPDFVFDQKADNNYTQTPWVTYTKPELNPNRELRFTPPLFDPVPKVWMVSALYPLYVDGKWIGSLGEDMALTGVLEFMFTSEQLYKDTEHFLIDTQGNFVLGGAGQKQLETSPEEFQINFNKNQSLTALFKKALTKSPQLLSESLMLNNRRYIAIGMILEPLGWHYYLLAPVDQIMASTKALFINLSEMLLLIGALNGLLVFTMTGRTITNRIQLLTNTMNSYGKYRHLRIANKLVGTDEISQAARAFDQMANDIEQNIAELNKRTEQLQSVFDVSPSGYVLINNDNKILLANKSVSLITGLSVPDLLRTTEEAFLAHFSNQATELLSLLKDTNQLLRIELSYPRHTTLLCGRREIVFADGELLGKLYFFHDISKEEESNRIKSEFLMNAAHELRTPLATIHGYSELLNSDMIPVEMQSEIISMIYQQSCWLSTMVDEFLDLSRIEERSGADFVVESYVLNDLIQQSISEFKIPRGRDAIFYVPIEGVINVNVDKDKFKKALTNIIDNAYTYSPNGGEVVITVHHDIAQNFVDVEVRDCGFGLTEDDISHVFDRFFRVDKTGNVAGVGLGLSLSKEIINLFGGDIRITSVPNKGSSVFIRLNVRN